MKVPKLLVGAAVLGLAALPFTAAQAQQPLVRVGDSIEIEYAAATCTVSIIWTDTAGDFSSHLRVSDNAAARPVVPIDDFVGDQDTLANPLDEFKITPGSHQIRARLFVGSPSDEKEIDEDLETHECVAPTATPSPTPTATATQATDDASITIRKVVRDVVNDPTHFQIDVAGGADDVNNLSENDVPVRRGSLTPGLFVLQEHSVPSGYQFDEWVCESDQLGADIDDDYDHQAISILLRAGEDVACTVFNSPKPATATPVPATSVPPAIQATPVVPVVNVPVTVNVPPQQVQQPSVSQPSTLPSGVSRIQAPNTGDGGLLGNPHCNGNSDNVHLPNQHTSQNFPGCD